MSTSNPTEQIPGVQELGLEADRLGALAAGLPDPAVLTRMANDLFREFASSIQGVGVLPSSVPTSADIPTSAPGSVMSAAQPGVLPTQLPPSPGMANPTGLAPSPPAAALDAGVPGIPGGLSSIPGASIQSFSFLEEARPLFSGLTAAAPPVASTGSVASPVPGESELRAIADAFSYGSVESIPQPTAQLAQPQIPGTVPRTGGTDLLPAPGFFDSARPLVGNSSLGPIEPQLFAASDSLLASNPFDVNAIRRDFPILQERVNGRPLIWLDNAATTQKPQSVIDRLSHFYEHENSNIHRAAHELAARSTDAYEGAREKVRRFLNASSVNEIVFVRGTTEAINLVAQSWGRRNIQKDDEIVITWLEHHANIVPWQMLCAEKGARLRVAPVDDSGQILLDEYEKLLNPRTRLVSFTQVSNALGTVTPVEEMVEIAHRHGAKVLVDGAQAVSHMHVDVQAYDCDFYVFSGHKVFAPTGIGVVYGKASVLEATPPWQGGGNMIQDVTFEKTVYQQPPFRFEAGTGNIADAVGLGAAIDYVERIGRANINRYEHDLLVYATEALRQIPGLRLIGTAREKAGVLSFVLDGFRTEDVGAALGREGIAVRSGHHCAQPILRRFGLESTVRPSLAFYNTCDEIDALVSAIWNLKSGRGVGLF